MDRSSGDCGNGNAWPPALRRRLGIPPSAATNQPSSSTTNASSAAHNSNNYYSQATATKPSANTSSNIAPLSSHELRQYIHDSYAKLTSIQRQLHRGEELYYEESYHHGTLLSFGFSADVHSIIGNYSIYICSNSYLIFPFLVHSSIFRQFAKQRLG